MIKTLSVCMIVKNEAAFIDAAIKSVGEIADQVVVVDTGSTDGTQEIARSAGAEVFSLPWPGSFAASRNESLSHATGDWILILDADERLHKNSAQSLRYLVNSAPAALIELKIINYMDDLQAQTASEHYSVRLFPNHYGLSFTGRIHEQLVVPHGWRSPGNGAETSLSSTTATSPAWSKSATRASAIWICYCSASPMTLKIRFTTSIWPRP